jgi:hypothetical protein
MYGYVLIAHGAWRWLVLAAGAAAVASALHGLARHAPWQPVAARWGRLFGIAVDIQALMGAALYFLLSPLTTGPAGTDPYFGVTHAATMAGALVAVHVSARLIRRGRSDRARQRRAALFYGLTFLILLGGIPWWRPLLRL